MLFDKEFILNTLQEILSIDSPTGFTDNVIKKIKEYAEVLGFPFKYTVKGGGIITVKGETEKTVGISTHVDTLGLMVTHVKADGTLGFTKVGAPITQTLDGEYCKVYTRNGKVYTGTILSNAPSSHVYAVDSEKMERTPNKMHVRLDEIVKNKNDTLSLGIQNGDFICYDTKTVVAKNGFIKSRFLDDKLSVALVLGVLKYFADNKITPKYNVKFMFSTYEEVGHGMSSTPSGITELLAVDMGCIGDTLSCTEYDVSICAKDATGPYDYELTTKLIKLAKNSDLKFAVDVYPAYSSDVSASLRGGNDIKGALIGPGVAASHGMERSHYDAVNNTMRLIVLYLTK